MTKDFLLQNILPVCGTYTRKETYSDSLSIFTATEADYVMEMKVYVVPEDDKVYIEKIYADDTYEVEEPFSMLDFVESETRMLFQGLQYTNLDWTFSKDYNPKPVVDSRFEGLRQWLTI